LEGCGAQKVSSSSLDRIIFCCAAHCFPLLLLRLLAPFSNPKPRCACAPRADLPGERTHMTTYVGEKNAQGQKHGHGRLVLANGSVYEGAFVRNVNHGFGRLTLANGNYYEGEFRKNCYEGEGKYVWGDGDWKGHVFKGHFKNGKRHGFGTYTYSNGDVYIGEYSNDMQHGPGKFTYMNGDYFTGHWYKDVVQGDISYHFSNGDILTGQVVRGIPVGAATLVTSTGARTRLEWMLGGSDIQAHAEMTRSSLGTLATKLKAVAGERESTQSRTSSPELLDQSPDPATSTEHSAHRKRKAATAYSPAASPPPVRTKTTARQKAAPSVSGAFCCSRLYLLCSFDLQR
jgi:hypothetical protein